MGLVNKADKLDYHKFTLRRSSSVSITLTGLQANADLTLLNAGGGVITRSNQTDNRSEAIATALEAGTYYIEIRHTRSRYTASKAQRKQATSYKLALTSVVEPGAWLASATDIGTLAGNQAYQNTIGGTDQTDYYRLSLRQISDFSVNFSGLSIGVDLNLILDRNGNGFVDGDERIATAYGSASGNSSISETLPPGTYFLEARTLSSDTSAYQLNLATVAKPSNLTTDPGDKLDRAYDLGILPANLTAQDLVGSLDSNDYYKFTLNQNSDFNATLSRLSDSVRVDLIWDANGNNFLDGGETIASGYGSPSSNDAISLTLPKGSYFMKVNSFQTDDYNTSYDLSLATVAKPNNIAIDPGNTLSQAYNLGTLTGSLVAQDLVGFMDKTDYYQFTLNQSGTFNATLSGLSSSVAIGLIRDANGNGLIDGNERLASGSGSTYGNSPISKTLQAGTYFLEVQSSSSNTAYSLTLAS